MTKGKVSSTVVDIERTALDPTNVQQWSLPELAAQLIVVSVGHHANGEQEFSDSLTDVCELLQTHTVGGVCYFPTGPNGTRPDVIKKVVDQLQASARLPLLVSIDQEGGLVTRMREPATRIPAAMALAAGSDWDIVETLGEISASELRAVGVNHVFAPVADVNTAPSNPVIGLRSASSSPEVVGKYVVATVAGIQREGVAACLKHFPGHGATIVDSHVGLPVLDTDVENWLATEALPFRMGIAAGVDSVMVGHLSVPALDPSGVPATFSRPIVTGLLRNKLGFDGVIVTDALDMAGAQMDGGVGEAAVLAFLAGADQLLMPGDAVEAIEALVHACEDGRIARSDMETSVNRIVALKNRLHSVGVEKQDSEEKHASNRAIARRAIRRALAWRNGAWSLEGAEEVVLAIDKQSDIVDRGYADVAAEISKHLEKNGVTTEIQELNEASPEGRPMILVTRDAWRAAEAVDAVRSAAAVADCVVAARSPYDAALVPVEVPVLLAFGDIVGAGEAIADALITGRADGLLPVDLADDEGHVVWKRRVDV